MLGADRTMFAIDYPYEQTAEAVHFFNATALNDGVRAKIAHENAERLFRIPPAPDPLSKVDLSILANSQAEQRL